MFARVMTVCFANICRSPVAEVLLRQALQEVDVEIDSSGIQAQPGFSAPEPMIQLMAARGIDLSTHHSKRVDDQLVSWSDLILVMEKSHQTFVESRYPRSCGKVQLLGRWSVGEIVDPFGGTDKQYTHAVQEIEEAVCLWAEKVWKIAPKLQSCTQE